MVVVIMSGICIAVFILIRKTMQKFVRFFMRSSEDSFDLTVNVGRSLVPFSFCLYSIQNLSMYRGKKWSAAGCNRDSSIGKCRQGV